MENYKIVEVNSLLMDVIDTPIKGKAKFKIFKIKMELEDKIKILNKSLEGVEDNNERTEILNEGQDVNFETLQEDDLEPLDLTIRQLVTLQPIIKGGVE